MNEFTVWMERAVAELEGSEAAWRGGNAGKGRVCARRGAGMALKALLSVMPRDGYGRSFMHHLRALADDVEVPMREREAAARLAAREPPTRWQVPPPDPLTPMADAQIILEWCRREGAS